MEEIGIKGGSEGERNKIGIKRPYNFFVQNHHIFPSIDAVILSHSIHHFCLYTLSWKHDNMDTNFFNCTYSTAWRSESVRIVSDKYLVFSIYNFTLVLTAPKHQHVRCSDIPHIK